MKQFVLLALSAGCLASPAFEKAYALSSYYAVVHSSGTLLRDFGAVNSSRVATGRYNVGFGRDVSNCSFIAAITAATRGAANALAQPHPSGKFLQVYTFGPSGTAANQNFTLMVSCPPTVVVRRGNANVPDGTTIGLSVPCETGETAIGGSADLATTITDTFVMSRPDSTGVVPLDGETFTGWRGTANNPTGGTGANTLRVYALCAR
jgi:hypothetical protein